MLHLVPTSIIEAMATGDILQIVVFSIVFAIGLGMVGEKARPMIEWCESLTEAMFKVTNIVMLYAPIGVGAAIAYTIGVSGLQVLQNLAFMIVTLYVALAAFFLLVLIPVMLMFRIPIVAFFKAIKEPALIAFSTTSSEAALPRAMECVEAFGVPRRIVSFILPLGYSFNLDGTTLYLSLAAVFIAQAGGIELTLGSAADDDGDADVDQQGRGRRAARGAGDPGGDGGELQPAARRRGTGARRRRADGHGPHHDQRDRQLPRVGGGGEVGRRVSSADLTHAPVRCPVL